MRKVNYEIQKESLEKQMENGRYNPALEIIFRDKTGTHIHTLGAGYSDTLDVYREDQETYVLTRNFGMGYVGLEIFNGSEKIGGVFLQSEDEITNLVGNIDKAPWNLIKTIAEYIY